MRGLARRRKRYVKVISETDEDGAITPTDIVWKDGRTYHIDRILEKPRRRASYWGGGFGMCYPIRVNGSAETTYLFHEDPRWFVEEKVPEGSASSSSASVPALA